MSEFKKYMHLERYGNDEVQGIELGQCFIFPKLDGTNASIWLDNDGVLQCGSRNRQLSYEADNAGFYKWVYENREMFLKFFRQFPECTLYGEWLVPHALKTYREEAWRDFYLFDIYDHDTECYIHYDTVQDMAVQNDINYIPAICVIKNVDYDTLLKKLEENTYLIKDGEGYGEGIVIKNYGYKNKYDRECHAKIVSNVFKEKHKKVNPLTNHECKVMVEQKFIDSCCDKSLVDKVYAKIANSHEGWNSRYIPALLGMVWHDVVTEEIWDFIKKNKNPTINFKTAQTICTMKIKQLLPEVF